MKVVICGAGQVGTGIATQLAKERNDVTVIDNSPELINRIESNLDVTAVLGHGSHPDVLEKAKIREADMLIAVTYADEVNMIACQVAHSLFDVPTKIARVRNQSYLQPEWQNLYTRENMPIDVIISPELEVGRTIMTRLSLHGAFESVAFADGKVNLTGLSMGEDCPLIDTPLRQLTGLFPSLEAIVVGVSRNDDFFVPKATDHLLVGDDVYLVISNEDVRRTLDIFGYEEKKNRRVVIVGGGNIGLYVAEQLEREHPDMRIKIIETNHARAMHIASKLKRTLVLHGDALSSELLREAGIANSETILALSNDDQVNLLASVLGKQEGAQRSMCLINNHDYRHLAHSFGVDVYINPRATTVSSVLQHVRRGRVKGLYSLHDGAAEVIDAEALKTSPLLGQPLREANLPDGIIIGAVVRDGKVLKPHGDTRILAGDRIIVLARADQLRNAEQLFRVSAGFF